MGSSYDGLASIACCFAFFLLFSAKGVLYSFGKYVSSLWLFVLSSYFIFSDELVDFSARFDEVFILFFLSMIFSHYSIFYFIRFFNFSMVRFYPCIRLDIVYLISTSLFMVSLLKFLYYYIFFGGMYYFRQGFLSDGLSLHVGISFPFVAAAFFASLKFGTKFSQRIFSLMLIVLGVISLSKIFVVIAIFFISGLFVGRRNLDAKSVLYFLLFSLLLFAALHIAMDKLAANQNSDSLLYSVLFTFFGYLLGGLAAFQLVLDGDASTGLVYKSILSFLTHRPDSVALSGGSDDGWVVTGNWIGNVYSGFSPWFEYFGGYGLAFYGALIGSIHAFLNHLSKKSDSFSFLRVFSFYPLTFVVFSDGYVGAIAMWVAFSLAAFMYSLIAEQGSPGSFK